MAANMYLKFSDPEIKGGSHDPGHAGEIEVLSWSHAFNQPASPAERGGGIAEPANHAHLTFSKYADSASAELLRYCWTGKRIGKALLSCHRIDGAGAAVRYLEIEMTGVVVANVSLGGGSGDMATENVALDYGVIVYRYQPAGGGAAEVSHNRITGVVS